MVTEKSDDKLKDVASLVRTMIKLQQKEKEIENLRKEIKKSNARIILATTLTIVSISLIFKLIKD